MPRIVISALLALAILPAKADVNFTPISSYYENEGIHFPDVIFRGSREEVKYVPPMEWQCTGDSGKCTLYPAQERERRGGHFGDAQCRSFPALSAETVERLTKRSRGIFCRRATATRRYSARLTIRFRIGGRPTVEFVFDCVIFAQHCRSELPPGAPGARYHPVRSLRANR